MKEGIAGQQFERLMALCAIPKSNGGWLFQCSCGKQKVIRRRHVTSGRVRSCGCLHTERAKSGLNPLRHGDARNGKVTRLHNIWRGMLKRVDATKGPAFQKYASRGISVDPLWRAYEPFREWALTNGYADDLTLDRVNNDGDYGPDNCRWVGWAAQARNRRSSRRIAAFNETLALAEWSERSGLKAETISARLALGWTAEDAVSKPVRR